MYTLQCRSVLGFKSSPGIKKKNGWSHKKIKVPRVIVLVLRAQGLSHDQGTWYGHPSCVIKCEYPDDQSDLSDYQS